jgi:PAS domain S-box-containing protein
MRVKMAKENANKKKMLKEVIKELHGGASPTEVKEKFKQVLKDTKPEDIAKIEQELVKEGMPREELQRLCDVHLAVFGEQVQGQELHISAGHPISILIEEHRVMLEKAERLEILVKMLEEACDSVHVGDALTELQSVVKDFQDSEKHYLREENVLFPTMEKHGVTEPPAIMWMEHNRIREIKKKLYDLVEKWNTMPYSDFKTRLNKSAGPLCSVLPDHFFKENNILFPTALQVVTDEEWEDIRREFDEIGYASFTPPSVLVAFHLAKPAPKAAEPSVSTLQFETGSLSKEEAEAILDTLPVDISFIDKDDRVKYFNKAEKRIFVRTKAVIGRSVQLCHPQKSVHIVNKITEAFTTGEKDTAEFWITMNNRLIHIRYFAVKDKKGKYLGTMEVTQDLTDLKKIEGQKRLLDWEE